MASISTSEHYLLKNGYTKSEKILALSETDDTLLMTAPDGDIVPYEAQWFVTTTERPGYYRLHTRSGDTEMSLDVINNNGTSSIGLHMANTGAYTGQYWQIDKWPSNEGSDYPYRLSNSFTGPDEHLDVYSNNLEAHLASGDLSGQHWTLEQYTAAAAAAATTTKHEAATTTHHGPASSITHPSPPEASSSKNSPALAPGAIASIAVGGVAVLAIIGLVLFMFILKRKKRAAQTGSDSTTSGEKTRPVEEGLETVTTDSQTIKKSKEIERTVVVSELHSETRTTEGVELPGENGQYAGPVMVELPGRR